MKINYDIIGDVHGRFDKLEALMERLGYEKSGDSFIPPAGHRALFLGDLIDAKPGYERPGGIRATLQAVRAMCDRGDALCIMGNHELNAIYFHSKGPDGRCLRVRGSKNIAMHQSTLDDFPNYDEPVSEWQQVWIPWMKHLPFFLELEGLRAVHACWHPEMIARIGDRNFDEIAFFYAAADKAHPEGEAMEILLKGIEVPLPQPNSFVDHAGSARYQFRARWWERVEKHAVCSDLVFPACDQIFDWPIAEEVIAQFLPYPESDPPVFFGHYFKPGHALLEPEKANVACLDHSAAKDGPLVAYRWKGEANIKPENYITNL